MLSQTDFQCDLNHKAFSYVIYILPSPKIKFIRKSCPFQLAYYYHQRTVEQLSNPTHGMFPNSLLQFHELICCLLLTTPHTSSPCNLYLHTTHPVFKEFLEKGGDFNQQGSQIPQLAHTRCFKSPAIGSARSQPHVCKLNLGP